MTVDIDQDRLMAAFDVVAGRLWVQDDPDWSLWQISQDLAVLVGDHLVVLALLDGQLLRLGVATDAEEVGRAIIGHPALDQAQARLLLAGLQEARP